MSTRSDLTPMLRHYLEVKAGYPDSILLYRMGDFFELFFEDAERAAPILEVTLTARQRGTKNEAAMCGVPHHAVEAYIGKLLRAGLRVVVCDQVEDPAQAKGLVKREVTRVVTPGTVSELGLLEGKEENLLASVVWRERSGAGAFLEVSTGDFFVRRWEDPEQGVEDLTLLRPREVLLPPDSLPAEIEDWIEREGSCKTALTPEQVLSRRQGEELLKRQLEASTLRGFGLESGEPAVQAAAAALAYAQETQKRELTHVRNLTVQEKQTTLVLDSTTLRNLEVFRSQRDGGRRGTLLAVLDHCVTPPGGRMLRDWLARPLRQPDAIQERQDAVSELLEEGSKGGPLRGRRELREALTRFGDPERLLSRAVLGNLTPREAAALRDGLAEAPAVLAQIRHCRSTLLEEIAGVDPVADLHQELVRVLEESPPAKLSDGGVIAAQVNPELDDCRSLARDTKRHIVSLQARERQETGISSLKIGYNRVFGYYIEVRKANQDLVPDHYVRKQTLTHAERYVTPGIKELEEKILGAEERQMELEEMEFEGLRRKIAACAQRVRSLARALARLDVLAALAEAAERGNYVRPQVEAAGSPICIREGRHPVVESSRPQAFVPNDTDLDQEESQIVLLTGPNMGGKSTYLRQVALIVLMAQTGSFVPATSAQIGVVDRLFTRVGASDDLTRGESTFMVEMIETANILRYAGPESLVILDEVGRGTATFDGLSLAWAIVEDLHERGRPKTLFATHYHELTELATLLSRVVNRTIAVKEWEERIVFLHRVVAGSADKSYGIHVARLAGLPAGVLERAAEVLANLEAQEYDLSGKPRIARGNAPNPGDPAQLNLFAPPEEVVASVLRDVDTERLTPLAALNLLQALKLRLGGG